MSMRKHSRNYPKRGEIWATDLRPGLGWEVAKIRPALVISNNAINQVSGVIIVIPISSQFSQILGPERILISDKGTNLKKDSVILTTQIRAADKNRLTKKIGKLASSKLAEVEDAMKIVLGLIEMI